MAAIIGALLHIKLASIRILEPELPLQLNIPYFVEES
jgi:hypothetical protein